jgi:hypothetical protein
VEEAPTQAKRRVGLVLTTLAAAQFLMLLDSSVMNVSIATVAKDVGTTVTGISDGDHVVHAGHGDVHGYGWQARRDVRAETRVHHRLPCLRPRFADHSVGSQPSDLDSWLVVF